jgi:hypothetical protein
MHLSADYNGLAGSSSRRENIYVGERVGMNDLLVIRIKVSA